MFTFHRQLLSDRSGGRADRGSFVHRLESPSAIVDWLVLLAGLAGGLFTVWLILHFHVASQYPWHLLTFGVGFSGGLLLAELVVYAVVVPALFRETPVEPDPLHPDRYGGYGRLVENVNALTTWLFVLVLLGNAFYLSAGQVEATIDPVRDAATLPFIGSTNWVQLSGVLSVTSTLTTLVAYSVVHVALTRMFRENRRRCIRRYEERYRATPDKESRRVLAGAHVMRTEPAVGFDRVVKGVLVIATAATFVYSLFDQSIVSVVEALARFFG